MSVDLLESADVTEIRLPSFLAKTIRDIALTAGIPNLGPSAYDQEKSLHQLDVPSLSVAPSVSDQLAGRHVSNPLIGSSTTLPEFVQQQSGVVPVDNLDLSEPFTDREMFDLSSLLGLPADLGAQGDPNNFFGGDMLAFDQGGYMSEFGFENGALGGTGGPGNMASLGALGWPNGIGSAEGLGGETGASRDGPSANDALSMGTAQGLDSV